MVLPRGTAKDAMALEAPRRREETRFAAMAAADEQVVKAFSYGSKMPLKYCITGSLMMSFTKGT